MGKLLGFMSFRGRSNRARFWLTTIAIYAVFLVGSLVSIAMSGFLPFLAVFFLPVFVAVLVASLANAARRLHDRNKSAWWLLLFIGVPTVFLLPAEAARMSPDPGASGFAALCALISLPVTIWSLVEMGCLKGTVGPNRFGEDPLRARQEAFA